MISARQGKGFVIWSITSNFLLLYKNRLIDQNTTLYVNNFDFPIVI